MILRKIKLVNFRNYKNFNISFQKNINIIIGDNAQGKTNILESIYTLALTKSYRTTNDSNLIRLNQEKFIIIGETKDEKVFKKLSLELYKGNKVAKINDNTINKISDYIGNLYVILSSPDDLQMIKGSPSERRNFLNIEISQLSSNYIKKYNEFNKILKMRNDYLKLLYTNSLCDYNYLDILTDNLIDREVEIYIERNNFINKINKYITDIYKNITGIKDLKIVYETNVEFNNFEFAEIKNVLKEKYRKNQQREIAMGMTLYGPHRDDFTFTIEGNDIKIYGSQGQQKLAFIALKFSEIPIFKEKTGTKPIILLDDIFSELDKTKKNKLIQYIDNDYQVIITSNDTKDISKKILKDANIFKIQDGKIIEKGGDNNGRKER
ncbi:MAG: DNA replication/repair protein RecF [Firmicutes bacterium]|nr:DNA replication/repair protein RecF [Bacillota bacterium]